MASLGERVFLTTRCLFLSDPCGIWAWVAVGCENISTQASVGTFWLIAIGMTTQLGTLRAGELRLFAHWFCVGCPSL